MSMDLVLFDSLKDCPKCGLPTKGYTVEYSTAIKVPAGANRFASISAVSDPPVPHLEKHCPHCGYGWLEETKDARSAKPPAVDVTVFPGSRSLDVIGTTGCKATTEKRNG